MKTNKWIYLALPVIIATVHAGIYMLPKAGAPAASAVRMELPEKIGDWFLRNIPATKDEVATLAKDTEFAKAVCLAPRPGEYDLEGRRLADRIDLSIVLSGHDLTSSIHRPERCMPAQGHDITSSSTVAIQLQSGRKFNVRRLLSRQSLPLNKEHTQTLELQAVTYYFFIGHNHITHDHTLRTLLDMRDRVIFGTDQRWAYISVTSWYGKIPWLPDAVSEREAETKIRQLLTKLAENSIDWSKIAQ